MSSMQGVLVVDAKCSVSSVDVPQPGEGEILVKVYACGINRLDVIQRLGKAKPPPGASNVLGLEIAGEIISIGGSQEDDCIFKVGDRVMSLVSGGGYAEFAVASIATTMKIPPNMSWIDAAGIPEAFLTAFQLVTFMGKVCKDDVVLIHAGASGVGTAAIQIITQYIGAKVYVTVGSQEKLDVCLSLGAMGGAIRHDGPWIDVLSEEFKSNGGGVDVILDCVGGSYAESNLSALKLDGRWVLYSMLGGPIMSDLACTQLLPTLLRKRIHLLATTLRGRTLEYKSNLVFEFQKQIIPLLEQNKIKILIYKVFTEGLNDAQNAHDLMQSNESIGKIILTLPAPTSTE